MISKIEQAVVARLRLGLGRMVRTVKSYGGEVEDLGQQLTTFPAVWVTYGGSRIEAANTAKDRYREQAELVVMVATRGLRSEEARRQGGADIREVGSNDLIRACRRLLDSQRLGLLENGGLTPKAVRPVVNQTLLGKAAVSVYAIEYTATWSSAPLENDRFPERQDDPQHPDHVFTKYQGELSEPWPWFEYFDALLTDPPGGAVLPIDLTLPPKEPHHDD